MISENTLGLDNWHTCCYLFTQQASGSKLDGSEMKHILLVYNERRSLESTEFILLAAEYKVSVAGSTDEAVQFIERTKGNRDAVDLVITDLGAPLSLQESLIDAIQIEDTQIPLLVMAGVNDRIDAKHLENKHRVACFFKPFREDELLVRIASLVQRP